MSLPDMAGGFVFLAWATGIGTFISVIAACILNSENDDNAGFATVVAIIMTIGFLTSGFFAASMR